MIGALDANLKIGAYYLHERAWNFQFWFPQCQCANKNINEEFSRYPELKVFKNDEPPPDRLYLSDPDRCCDNLKVQPTRQAIEQMNVECWVTGLRCTEGRTRVDFAEIEERDRGLLKLNPILIWQEREV